MARNGGAVPAGLSITLHSFDGQTLMGTFTTTADAQGGFQFAAVPFTPGRQFLATTSYQGVTYASQVGVFDAASGSLTSPCLSMMPRPTPAALSVDQVHMFLEFNSPNTLTVGQLFIFSNNGDRAYDSSPDHPLNFSLPPGATNLNVQNAQQGQSLLPHRHGFSLVWSVPPGQGSTQILFSFDLPYPDKVDVPADDRLSGEQCERAGLGPGRAGVGHEPAKPGPAEFPGPVVPEFVQRRSGAGANLSLSVEGKAGTGATAPNGVLNSTTGTLAIGMGAVVVVLGGIGVWFYRRPARGARPPAAKKSCWKPWPSWTTSMPPARCPRPNTKKSAPS